MLTNQALRHGSRYAKPQQPAQNAKPRGAACNKAHPFIQPPRGRIDIDNVKAQFVKASCLGVLLQFTQQQRANTLAARSAARISSERYSSAKLMLPVSEPLAI
jgi:hypothetical protein